MNRNRNVGGGICNVIYTFSIKWLFGVSFKTKCVDLNGILCICTVTTHIIRWETINLLLMLIISQDTKVSDVLQEPEIVSINDLNVLWIIYI